MLTEAEHQELQRRLLEIQLDEAKERERDERLAREAGLREQPGRRPLRMR